MSLPTLEVSYPADHPMARRAAAQAAARLQQAQNQNQQAQERSENGTINSGDVPPIPSISSNLPPESVQARLLDAYATPLSMPNSPAEQARRSSLAPASRRNSLMSIPPPLQDKQEPHILDHIPQPGHDDTIDQQELEKELHEIDTIG